MEIVKNLSDDVTKKKSIGRNLINALQETINQHCGEDKENIKKYRKMLLNFSHMDFKEATLTRANLEGADFREANLEGAIINILSLELILEKTKNIKDVILVPEGLYDTRGYIELFSEALEIIGIFSEKEEIILKTHKELLEDKKTKIIISRK